MEFWFFWPDQGKRLRRLTGFLNNSGTDLTNPLHYVIRLVMVSMPRVIIFFVKEELKVKRSHGLLSIIDTIYHINFVTEDKINKQATPSRIFWVPDPPFNEDLPTISNKYSRDYK